MRIACSRQAEVLDARNIGIAGVGVGIGVLWRIDGGVVGNGYIVL